MGFSNDELLKKCLQGKTQNNNESMMLFGKYSQRIFMFGIQYLR